LAQLPGIFDTKAMMEHIEFLTSIECQGRGLGLPGLEQAGDYIAQEFQKIGLIPLDQYTSAFKSMQLASPNGASTAANGASTAANGVPTLVNGAKPDFFQTWQHLGPQQQPMMLRNIIAILPGNAHELQDAPVIVGAHYDHLGFGWPDVKQGNQGKLHPGANDNASGIAVLLELAVHLKERSLARPIVFVAFTGEEAGQLGSAYFVGHWPIEKEKIMAMVNLDSVGKLGNQPIFVVSTNTAKEWPYIFKGCSMTTGIPIANLGPMNASDHIPFIQANIPSVHLLGAADVHYHSPQDNLDNITPNDLEKVAQIALEAIVYLANRKEPLTQTIAQAPANPAMPAAASKRSASLGIIPDFQSSGPGLGITGTGPDSAASKAGLQAGDILLKIDGVEINGLADLARVLAQHSPGDVIQVTYSRNGSISEVSAVLQKR